MIYCFSGTGNSLYVAKRISEKLNIPIKSINDAIKNNEKANFDNDDTLIFVTPTYAWRIPKIVEKWIRQSNNTYHNKAYFIMTCGSEIGNATKYLKSLCSDVNFDFMGCGYVVMPENYIAMFSAPNEKEAISIINNAESKIDKYINLISSNNIVPEKQLSLIDKIYSSFVNNVFYSLIVKDKKFFVKNNCVSCGKCVDLCPLNNICLVEGKPVWKGNCTHCMACICNCPVEAIEYGRKSKNQPRYKCPK